LRLAGRQQVARSTGRKPNVFSRKLLTGWLAGAVFVSGFCQGHSASIENEAYSAVKSIVTKAELKIHISDFIRLITTFSLLLLFLK
jgi:hypothetical protein